MMKTTAYDPDVVGKYRAIAGPPRMAIDELSDFVYQAKSDLEGGTPGRRPAFRGKAV
jgi:hypothetical protein